MSFLDDLPFFNEIDFGAFPVRTNKAITLRCYTPETTVEEQGIGGKMNKFYERVIIDIAVRAAPAEGERLGREPDKLIAIEKYLVEQIKINRNALHEEGVQYMDVSSVQTFPSIEGGEDTQQIWYHCKIFLRLCYWLKLIYG